jgi:hypothetical protein
MIDRLLCYLGWHSWQPWQYLGQPPCHFRRSCRVCDAQETTEEHQWGEWVFTSPNDCHEERVCRRCKGRERRTEHSWVWRYEDENRCTQIQVCRRCRRVNPDSRRMAEHRWGQWVYESETSCVQVRFCQRCHERQRGEEAHRWTEWQHGEGMRQSRVCTHCNLTQRR